MESQEEMDPEEYDDELPPISVNSSNLEESVFAMPSAEVLASQRARASECERELLRLRELHERQDSALNTAVNTETITPSRSNSSGSEGETALASAVEALRVNSGGASAGAGAGAEPSALLCALRELPAAAALSDAYCRAGAASLDTLTDDMITSIWSWLSGLGSESDDQRSPSDDEVVSVGAWLCAVVLRVVPQARARRALHALLAAATHQQVVQLSQAVIPLLEDVRSLLWLAVALGAGGERPGAPLAHALHRAALARLLQGQHHLHQEVSTAPLTTCEISSLVCGGWRRVPAPERDVALQLLGRALLAARHAERAQHAERGERAERAERAEHTARALAALAQPCADRADKHRPDHLKVAVAASKLKILLSDRN